MISKFKLCKSGACGIQVKGLERDTDLYLDEAQVSTRNYTFEHSITLNILIGLDSKENQTLEQSNIVPHIDIDEDLFIMDKDGLKLIDHCIIPTNEWLEYVIERDINALDIYSIVYYFNKEDELFYKLVNGRSIKVGIEELMEVNADNTTIIKSSLHTILLCHLEECFYKLCKYLLENMPCSDPCFDDKMKAFKDDILNRDIIWMAINAIKYCIDLLQFYRAQAIIEQIETCWGICKNLDNINSSNYKGCGCHS